MGLFFNYDKPGKGVDKDAPKKKGIFLYFELMWRKLGKLFTSNMLYFLVSLPVILIYHFFSYLLLSNVIPPETDPTIYSQLTLIFTALITILFGTGPVSCGYTFLLRNFAKEEHVWLTSDFFQKIKENFKQGIVIFLADILVLFLGTNSIMFYSSIYKSGHQIGLYMTAIVFLFMMMYTFMHFYLYQFAITFDNKITAVFKNSFIMALASLPMNIFLTMLVLVLTYMLFSVLTPVAIVLVMLLFWISFMRFPIDFYSARIIQRKLIDSITTGESDE